MRALFLVPPAGYDPLGLPVDRVYGCNYGFDYKPPIHLLAVATWAREALGWRVELRDCPAEGRDRARFEGELSGLGGFDAVLFWSTYLSAAGDLRTARRIAAAHPGMRLVFMGAAATWRPDEFRVTEQSYCLLGEPEHTLRDLDRHWRGQGPPGSVPGLGWFEGERFRRGPVRELLDLTELPMPDRRLLAGKYRANRLAVAPVTTMVVSRGCGFGCTFCTTNALDQAIDLELKRRDGSAGRPPPPRKRTVAQVVDEFADIARLGIAGVELADNVFTWGKARTLAICAGVEPLGLEWICLARADMLHDPELVRAMGRAGCRLVYMGSESFVDGLLDDMAKEIAVRDVARAVRVCRDNGVEPEVSVLIGGSPRETWRTFLHSLFAARRLGTRFVHFSVALPAPSTRMYDEAIARGWFAEGDFRPADNQREVLIDLPHLSRGELRLALELAYAVQYLSPGGLWRQASHVRTLADLRHKAAGARALLAFLARPRASGAAGIPPGRVSPPGG